MLTSDHASASPAQIPIIDISPQNKDAASELLAAARDHGFVFVENNASGIPEDEIHETFSVSKTFFNSPPEVKTEYSINSSNSGKNRGYAGLGGERLDPKRHKRGDMKEVFNFGEPNPSNHSEFQQPLPPILSEHQQSLTSFYTSCHTLCTRILSVFAIALKIEDTQWFSARHDRRLGKESGSVLRLLHYPDVPKSPTDPSRPSDVTRGPDAADEGGEKDIRAGAHSDYGSITLLFQQRGGQPGLEILTRDGEWVGVPVDPRQRGPQPGTATAKTEVAAGFDRKDATPLPILVNIGDLLSFWTNGLLRSTVHRVVFPPPQTSTADLHREDNASTTGDGREGGDRYSIAFFCHPLDEAVLEPVPSELVKKHASGDDGADGMAERGKVMTAREHLNQRLAATYDTVKHED